MLERSFKKSARRAKRHRPIGQAAWHGHRPFWRGLRMESLESRIALTTNLAMTSISEVDSSGQALTTINAGQSIDIKANFTTQGLPSNASYRIAFTLNGFTRYSSTITLGAGGTGTQGSFEYWGSFIATPGTNQVTVNLDPDQSVAESSYADNTMSITFSALAPMVGSYVTYSAAQIRQAYGINNIPSFGSAMPDGTGQTIAIVDAYNDPSILTDLDGFDQVMSLSTTSSQTLYQAYGAASSLLTVYNQSGVDITSQIANSGTGGVPPVESNGGWELEETLDVEWAHAIAPGAKIDLIETSPTSPTLGLFIGAATAASLSGVSVVSMSWIEPQSATNGEALDASTFVTPASHTGVTFLASDGDGGQEPTAYPSSSPNVIGVAGTQLTVNGNNYASETAWSFPAPTSTVSNGSSAYLQAGSWSSQSGGFSGNYSTAPGGSASTATWSTSITSADQGWDQGTEVSATWTANPGNATNATYSIYDGTQSTGRLLGTVSVNQTIAPVGISDGISQFQSLGDFFPTSGTLTVVLNANSANGTVVADAVGVAKGWATGGGQSHYEPEPSYQLSVQNTGFRTAPDVSFDGSSSSGVTCYQNGSIGFDYYGTSLSCPCWAGLMAIADQGRAAEGGSVFNNPANEQQALAALYSLPTIDFNDITTGYDGASAGVGYDQVTGLGSPLANLVVPDLVAYAQADQLVATQPPATVTAGVPFSITVEAEDQFGNVDSSVNGAVTVGGVNGTFVNGVATVSVKLTHAASGTSLAISGDGFSTQTNSFNVIPGPLAQLAISSSASSGTAGASLSLTITAEDAFGNLVSGFTDHVTLADSLGGATFSAISFNGGRATVTATLDRAGTQALTATDTTSSTIAAGTSSPLTVNPATATRLLLNASPTNLSAGQITNLAITAEDSFGNVVDNFNDPVTLADSLSGESFSNVSFNEGVTTVAATLDTAGTQTITAIDTANSALKVNGAVTVTPGAVAQLVISAQPPATVTAGGLFGLTVFAEDAEGNIATNFTGSETIAIANHAGSSTLGGTLTINATAGVASATDLSLDKVGVGYTLGITSAGLMSATTNAISVSPGAATQLIIATQVPDAVTAGADFGFTVEALDAEGNLATGFAGNVIASLANNPGNSTLGGATTITVGSGMAVFSNLTLNNLGTAYTLSLASLGLAGTTFGPFNIAQPNVATELLIATQPPATVTAGSSFGLTVETVDGFGTIDTTYDGPVTVALAANPGGGTLAGTLTLNAVSGVAVFSNLSINRVSSGYKLAITSGTLFPTTSSSLAVSPGVATQLLITGEPPATVAAGSSFGVTVEAEDAAGNLATNFNGTVTVAVGNNSADGALAGTASVAASGGIAVFSGLSLNNAGTGYTLQAGSGSLALATTSAVDVTTNTLTITGAPNDQVNITFIDSTDFTVTINGKPSTSYSTLGVGKVVYNGPVGANAQLIFDDETNTDNYTATQSLTSTSIVREGFEFDSNNVGTLYVYVTGPKSKASVDVGRGAGANFFVAAASGDYSYIADPIVGIYSELAGFGAEAVTGAGGSTYAYLYSTSHATFDGDAAGSTFSVGGVTSTLGDFAQVYFIGSSDGTDAATLHTDGGTFVATPSFSYVGGTFNGQTFLIGALYAAKVTAAATNPADTAFFYSYAGDTFHGSAMNSTFSGNTSGFANSANYTSFSIQAMGFQAITVDESGTGTDSVDLSSPGNSVFTSTPTVSTLSVNDVTMFTVLTSYNDRGLYMAVPCRVEVGGASNDTAYLYDGAGINGLAASGSNAVLTRPANSVSVSNFAIVYGEQTKGDYDTVQRQAIDFALQLTGDWTNN